MSPETKLYRHRCTGRCPDRWSKFPTNEEEYDDTENTISKDPIVHRHVFSDHQWVTDSFTINSPAMQGVLSTVLAKYQDLDLELEKWTFKPPFMPLVHRWDRLLSLCDATDKEPVPEASTQLLEFLTPILAPKVDALVKTRKTGNVMFADLWQIFAPHEFVITKFYGVDAVCRVTKYKLVEPSCSPPYWEVYLEYLDWNGNRCGYSNTMIIIPEFAAYRRVTSLPAYPLSFHNSPSKIRQQMIERGRKFETLRGYHFQACSGTKILLPPGKSEERPVSGRVIVDAHAYYLTNDIVKPDLASLIGDDQPKKQDEDEKSDKNKSKRRSETLEDLTDDMCLVATPWLKGFDLKTKEWAQFYVDDLTPVVWNDAAFNHLVLPGTEKQLAWEFVENKTLANSFDDFIQDKGRGIIILMFGPPGVGKTYTAEAVAEKARVPLYSMSAGDLGTVPKEVELALERGLTLCGLWNAMLLLDEADVFLGARTDSDLARNELVAVFLTKLEYYTGVCFLTTNRTASIDTAFQSRVDLFLPYKDLTFEARKKVWQNFINRAGGTQVEIPDEEMNKLAEMKLNGREIKNLIKSAHLLGLKNGGVIQVDRLLMLAQNRVAALGELKNN
ncbi:Fidgetin-like protein 1 [Fusarium odoratissimum]|uniref:Fidgetin-like protein 1 n=1 Tax=Fusarium oxysporum f. sp. cubense (strain race 4) TaxID=2502994 RepID=N1RLK9_FUSC4|nr:Fidgetin-like protein 1 [Fusarium odoratissimum]